MKAPTPETDEHQDGLVEAQRVIREQHAQVIGLYAIEDELRNERDQLRKVCDELANATRAEFGNMNWRLDAYNQLPHVKK